eukprot:TRINITY_DN2722_c0_g1_i3.p1 TRINITY_DN2722_c0_g1~~TRINITY_DN2722_c0_g1_i3.p1  ORF type:complete len:124 (-),score=5.67 TRINITY_DN2722_c0_g1_i3:598-969(-)
MRLNRHRLPTNMLPNNAQQFYRPKLNLSQNHPNQPQLNYTLPPEQANLGGFRLQTSPRDCMPEAAPVQADSTSRIASAERAHPAHQSDPALFWERETSSHLDTPTSSKSEKSSGPHLPVAVEV